MELGRKVWEQGYKNNSILLNVKLISISYVNSFWCILFQFFSADERRLAHMMSKLNSSTSSSRWTAAGPSSGGKSIRTDTAGSGGSYAGGIFSRLEAQFRAQQTAKALALQSTQTRQVKCQLEIMFKTSISVFSMHTLLYTC